MDSIVGTNQVGHAIPFVRVTVRFTGTGSQPSAEGLGCVWNTPTTMCPDTCGGLARLTSDWWPGAARRTVIAPLNRFL